MHSPTCRGGGASRARSTNRADRRAGRETRRTGRQSGRTFRLTCDQPIGWYDDAARSQRVGTRVDRKLDRVDLPAAGRASDATSGFKWLAGLGTRDERATAAREPDQRTAVGQRGQPRIAHVAGDDLWRRPVARPGPRDRGQMIRVNLGQDAAGRPEPDRRERTRGDAALAPIHLGPRDRAGSIGCDGHTNLLQRPVDTASTFAADRRPLASIARTANGRSSNWRTSTASPRRFIAHRCSRSTLLNGSASTVRTAAREFAAQENRAAWRPVASGSAPHGARVCAARRSRSRRLELASLESRSVVSDSSEPNLADRDQVPGDPANTADPCSPSSAKHQRWTAASSAA